MINSNIEHNDVSTIRLANDIISAAIARQASDIHFEPYEKKIRIRFRIDGILSEFASLNPEFGPRLAARLKVLSRLDISERRLPQDGRFKLKLPTQDLIDLRISSCPTLFGEKIVLRILDPANTQVSIEALGFEAEQQAIFVKAIRSSQGMILATGPTGSGKTLSLYTAINLLNDLAVNISTIEDPIEINLPGINQVHVNPKVGLTFSNALRAFLRQDPDIIMVGEIRDPETAEIAVKAAQTGHLVLSTLHTNSAAETITRLINMGIPAYHLATAIKLVFAQRLVRLLCTHCKQMVHYPPETLLAKGFDPNEILGLQLFRSGECDQCHQGYKGRIGIFEVMPISETISRMILSGSSAIDIAKQAKKEGMITLQQAGLNKVKTGVTSFEEVERIT
ncbi:MAG: GspE/PulE family protein [Candidatus Berkiellales bacterium]